MAFGSNAKTKAANAVAMGNSLVLPLQMHLPLVIRRMLQALMLLLWVEQLRLLR